MNSPAKRALILLYIFLCISACETTRTTAPFPSSLPHTPEVSVTVLSSTPSTVQPSAISNQTTQPSTQTPLPEVFVRDIYHVEEMREELQDVFDFNQASSSLPSGLYIIFFKDYFSEQLDTWITEVHYSSIDGSRRGKILSTQTDPTLIGITRDQYHPIILITRFYNEKLISRSVDWISGNMRTIVATGSSDIIKELKGPRASPDLSHAFSPDGRWLVWDCAPDRTYAWCLIDLTNAEGWTIIPGGEVISFGGHRGKGYFKWSPQGDWFLASCESYIDPDQETQCLIFPRQAELMQYGFDTWAKGGIPPYLLRDMPISPDGRYLYILDPPKVLEDEVNGSLVVLNWDCIFSGICDTRRLYEFVWGNWQEAIWSPSGDQLALSYFPYSTTPGQDVGPTRLVTVNLEDNQSKVIFEYGPPGLLVTGWSPDGKWLALQNTEGKINPYAIYVVSIDGLFRGVVPMEEARIVFLGWFVVP